MAWLGAVFLHALAPATGAHAMGLVVAPQDSACVAEASVPAPLIPQPVQANQRLANSQAVAGRLDVAWAWLGNPTVRYPHRALGSASHAASLHAVVKTPSGGWHALELTLPLHRVYEDLVPRIIDLDRDGSEEIVLIEADVIRGASLVVLGVDHQSGTPRLVERARSSFAGTPFRWLNPVGVADFDADGQLDLAMVRTPHIGGELQLLHYRPPVLVPYARVLDVSNHRMGAVEQDLAVVVQLAGQRPTIVVPDMTLRALHALRWDASGRWVELSDVKPLPGRIEELAPMPGGACALLDDGRYAAVRLMP
ncbi:MAG: VCBS repeat-containing protein [Serpentinimonas sp.]|nr:VCBS repeat-containing protein [Serpentinimonas sp.]